MMTFTFKRRTLRLWLAGVASILLVGADDPKPPTTARPSALSVAQVPVEGVDPEVIEALDESYPDRPEWVDMLSDILQGGAMGPNYGWFRTDVTQTRFGWDSTRKRLDLDADGQVARQEFSGSDADFARLDRDRDGVLTGSDFDFSQSSLAPSPGLMFYFRADLDGNGKVTREEFEALFKSFDGGGHGFLSQADLVEAMNPMPRPASLANGSKTEAPRASGGPSKSTLVRGLFNQEIGSLEPGPKLDAIAPDFTLKTNDGLGEVNLSKLVGPKPVVLIFGNFTCGPFRAQAGNLEKLSRRYQDRAKFLMVYVREAHPTDGWRMENNDRAGVSFPQPRTDDERRSVAQTCSRSLGLGFPMLVDSMDDSVNNRYSAIPSRFYLIDRQGKIAFKSGRDPFGFKPAEMEQSLIFLLNWSGGAELTKRDQPDSAPR